MLHFYSLRECYRRVGIVPKQSHRSSPFNSKNLFILMGLFLMFISSLAYLLFEAKSIGKSADSIYMVLSSFVCVIIFLISIWKISTILELIEDYERFIEKRSADSSSKATYTELIEKIERASQLIQIGVIKLTIPGVVVPALLITLIDFFVYDFGDESFYLPFPVMLPFNWKTPLGYFVALLMQCIEISCMTYADVPIFCFLFQSCQLFEAFVEDISKDVSLLDVKTQSQLTEQFISLVRNFSTIKQFVNKFNGCYEYIVTTISLWANLTICSTLLTLQFEISDPDLNEMELLRPLVLVVWAFGTYFLFCECGEMMSDQFNQFDETVCNCNWHLFPIELQQMFVVVVANSQQSTDIRGFGNVLCARQSFKATSQTGFSYFTMLRQIDY